MKPDSTGKVKVADMIRELISKGALELQECSHLALVQDVTPTAEGCTDCLKLGEEWVHLRLCLTCGYVGCCDNSKNRHATRHHHVTNHPMIVSFEPGETWLWCYIDQVQFIP